MVNFIILSRTNETTVLWTNPFPNSPYACRPQALIRVKEDDAVSAIIPYTDKCRDELNKEPVMVTPFREVSINNRFLRLYLTLFADYSIPKMFRIQESNITNSELYKQDQLII